MTPIVCRICLDGNVKMHCIKDHKLLEIYEKLSSSKMNTEDGLPTTICYICVSQLQRCRRFFDMARESIKTLTHRIHSGLRVTSNNATSENLGETHHLTVTSITHMIVKHVEDCQVKVNQEQVAVKEEPAEYGDLLDIEESRLNDVVGSSENITHMTVKHVEDCQVKVKQEQVDVKEDPDEYEVLFDIEERTFDDFDVASSENMEQPLLKESSDQSQYYKKHKKTHTGDMPYACDICKKAFRGPAHLKRHMIIHTGEKPYACHICKKAFNQSANLKKHMLIHAGEKLYACDICNRAFNQPETLTKHMLIHTDEKPYACNICNKDFNRAAGLKKHLLVHTGEKPYACNICKKDFYRAESLKKHMVIHTH